jgi:hypothetical protein
MRLSVEPAIERGDPMSGVASLGSQLSASELDELDEAADCAAIERVDRMSGVTAWSQLAASELDELDEAACGDGL